MIVHCSTCSARFNVPDAKVAGRRARMKCKKCGAPIVIDGTAVAGSVRSSPTHTPPSRPGSSKPHNGGPLANEPLAKHPQDISTRWRIQAPTGERLEASLDEAAVLVRERRLPIGTLICAPGKTRWAPPSNFPELERRAGLPVSAPRPPLPTFTDVTVALGAAETEVLKFQSRPAHDPEFFNPGDVAEAMASFDQLAVRPARPPSVAPQPLRSSYPPPPSNYPPPASTPPPLPSNYPLQSARSSAPPPGSLPLPSTPPKRSQTITSFPPPPPSDPGYVVHHHYAAAASAPAPWPAPIPPLPPENSPFSAPPAPPASALRPVPTPLPRPQLAEADWEGDFPESGAAEYAGVSKPKRRIGMWITVFAAISVVGTAIGIQTHRPQLVRRARAQVMQLVARWIPQAEPTPPVATGPEFDTSAAGLVLSRAAQQADQCRDPAGPVGKGRARVLFHPSGKAIEVAVSEPFHNTAVGQCIVQRFLETNVPPFGGQAVIVNKTFEVR